MTDLNRELHLAFDLPWDTSTEKPRWEVTPDRQGWVYNDNQDLLSQVSAPCGGCGGTGRNTKNIRVGDGAGGYNKPYDLLPLCPTCDGLKVRRITRLQQVMEERGEWHHSFLEWLFEKVRSYSAECDVDDEFASIFTDANKLGKLALAWKKGG